MISSDLLATRFGVSHIPARQATHAEYIRLKNRAARPTLPLIEIYGNEDHPLKTGI